MDSTKIVRVLLVEDNSADARLIKEACGSFAVRNEVDMVENGIEAMEYLYKTGKYKNSKTPNLIILDLNLPKKSGREVLKEVKQDDKLKIIPIIILTTSQDEDDVCNSYKYHANAYITKPADFEEFDELICSFEEFWFNKAILPACQKCK